MLAWSQVWRSSALQRPAERYQARIRTAGQPRSPARLTWPHSEAPGIARSHPVRRSAALAGLRHSDKKAVTLSLITVSQTGGTVADSAGPPGHPADLDL